MAIFPSRSRAPSKLSTQLRRHPFLFFGLPFLSLVVASSFAMQEFTQTRYDYHGQKVRSMDKEEELGMSRERKRVDIREEYYRLNDPKSSLSSLDAAAPSSIPRAPTKRPNMSFTPTSQDEYEPVRVPRPSGVPEWGGGFGGPEAELKGRRKEDRWV
ncbi:cytochrome c oxidase assembly protein subunit 16, partial [Tremellales sp. Uapishka_1]